MVFKRIATCLPVALLLTFLVFPWQLALASPSPIDFSVAARGRQEVTFTVSVPGRYAVSAKSEQGTAIRIINRMSGPGRQSGTPGEKNGRTDLLLDEGEYKIVALSHEDGSGEAQLRVQPFTELNAPGILLVENKLVSDQLGDFEQRSYWIHIKSKRSVILEAAGRNLSDLRLWKDGSWLYDAKPSRAGRSPVSGRPLRFRRMSLQLQPGLYLLTAYGGPSEPWADQDEKHPFHLRYGIPKLPEAGRRKMQISPMGIDRFLVPARATYYRLELPESADALLEVKSFSASSAFGRHSRPAKITKKSRLPVAEFSTRSRKGYERVTIIGTPGQPYILQHFDARNVRKFKKSGFFWLSTIHSGDPRDSVDVTAILFEHLPTGKLKHRNADVVEIVPGKPWSRRFNLIEEGTVFLNILEPGRFSLSAPGSNILVQVKPFMIRPPSGYREPDFRPAGNVWDLDRGYHILTAKPLKKGIVTLSIAAEKETAAAHLKPGLQNPSAIFEKIKLRYGKTHSLYINRQPGVRSGMVLRPIPLDLSNALPLSLNPDQTVRVPFRLQRGQGTLLAEAEDGEPLEVSLDGINWSKSVRAEHNGILRVRNPGDDIAVASVWLELDSLKPDAPLPPLPAKAIKSLPDFTIIDTTAPVYFDLDSKSSRTFKVSVQDSAFYNLESTGLLDTKGNLRAKIITSLGRDSGSGLGRNFFIGRYLREGDYQVTVATKGRSAGHLGLRLTKSAVVEGGNLRLGIPARVTLPAGQGCLYTLNISKPGSYRFTGYGLDRILQFRLEDEDGWPIIKPNQPMNLSVDLDEGKYRIFLFPEMVTARRVIMVRSIPDERDIAGHGPHTISLNTGYENVWMEPIEGQKRLPDVWRFDLSASTDIAISLTGEMQGRLAKISEQDEKGKGLIIPVTGWTGRLEEGQYKLETDCSRINNRVPYRLLISTKTLLAGMNRHARAPVDIPISVGSAGLVEISSFGKEDIRARLIDREGNPVVRQDDRPDDWNFQITRRLAPGQYTLEVRPVGREKAQFKVFMESLHDFEGDRIKTPSQIEITPADGVTLLPLETKNAGVISLSARSLENVGLILEHELPGGHWETVWSASGDTISGLLPLTETGSDLRLRLWSMDRRNLPVSLTVDLLEVASVKEAQISKGIKFSTFKAANRTVNLAAISTEKAGLLKIVSGSRIVKGSAHPLTPLSIAADGFLRAGEKGVWVAVEDSPAVAVNGADEASFASDTGVSIHRFILSEDDSVYLDLAPGEEVTCDVEGGKGIVLLTATSLGGQPGLFFSEHPLDTDAVMAVFPNSAAAVLVGPASPTATIFNAGDPDKKMGLKLKRRRFPSVPQKGLAWGQSEGHFSGEASNINIYNLPDGSKRIRISTSGDVAAALVRNERVTSLSWAGAEAVDELLVSEADRLVLLHTGSSPARYAIQVLPNVDGKILQPVDVSRPLEHRFIDGGTARVKVKGANGARLKVEGVAKKATLVTARGRILEGTDLPLTVDDAELIIHHSPGYVVVWIEDDGKDLDLWGRTIPHSRTRISKADVVSLSGSSTAIELETGKPSVAHLRVDIPAVIRSRAAGDAARTKAHPEGGHLVLYMPDGRGEAWIRGLGGAGLQGTAQVIFSRVIHTGEGLGPEVIIPAGESRFFSFRLDHHGKVGIGVRGDSDVVHCALINPAGEVLGEGVIQMPTLDPGGYFIRLNVPPSVEPVRARLAVLGLDLPGSGPPEEEIKKYIEMAGIKGGQ